MQLELEREILRLKPHLSVKQVENLANDIAMYWIHECLADVLDTNEK